MEASNFGTLSRCSIILLHAVHDCPGGRTTAIVHHVSFAQITCLLLTTSASMSYSLRQLVEIVESFV